MLVLVHICQNVKLLEISCRGSYLYAPVISIGVNIDKVVVIS